MAKRRHNETRKGQNQSTKRAKSRGNQSYPSIGTDQVAIYGTHATVAALQNPNRQILRVLTTKNALSRLDSSDIGTIQVEIVDAKAIDAVVGPNTVHQGILAICAPLPEKSLEDIFPSGPMIVLDQVTDPQNVGAILRTSCAFGVAALLTTSRNAPAPSGALAKAASGALEHTPYIQTPNLARAIHALNNAGYMTVGLSDRADTTLDVLAAHAGASPIAIVLGAEGKGIRDLTAKTCTHLAKLALPGQIKTLNVSSAAAVALQITAGSNPQ